MNDTTHIPDYTFRLYIAGRTTRTSDLEERIRSMLSERLAGRTDLEIIDVLNHPELARESRVFATPTLMKVSPEPACRVFGDFSNMGNIISALGLADHIPPCAGAAAR